MSAVLAPVAPAPDRTLDDPGRLRAATVRRVHRETPDTMTFWLVFPDRDDRLRYRFGPGQFNMLDIFGIGEVPISICSDPALPARLGHTVRSTGRVTNAFPSLRPGDRIGVRGPFGRPWPVEVAVGGDVLVIGGGLGFAPVRPVLFEAMRRRPAFRRVTVLLGARAPEHMLYRRELDAWSRWFEEQRVEVLQTVDVTDDAWPYHEGVVTTLFEPARIDPERTTAYVCGPEIMMRFAVRDLLSLGVPAGRIFVSLERNMQCGVRRCGHCQLGPLFVCADGPVFSWDEVDGLLEVNEL